jgi:hypothetical protein
MALSDRELDRYARHIVLPQVGGVGQNKLKAAKVAVIGAGGIGSAVIPALAGAGVGQLTIIDDDAVELANLHRQPLFAEADAGKPKAELAAAFAGSAAAAALAGGAAFAASRGTAAAALATAATVTAASGSDDDRQDQSRNQRRSDLPHFLLRLRRTLSPFSHRVQAACRFQNVRRQIRRAADVSISQGQVR